MDQHSTKSAMQVANSYEEKDLAHLFSAYGEVKNAKILARELVSVRLNTSIKTSGQLREIAWKLAPRHREMKYLAQVFQAIRIEVNEELESLKEFLEQAGDVLKPNGRLVVVSYHSLEDRMVKRILRDGVLTGEAERDIYGVKLVPWQPLTRRPVVPDAAEVAANRRSRSAKLRAGVRCAFPVSNR